MEKEIALAMSEFIDLDMSVTQLAYLKFCVETRGYDALAMPDRWTQERSLDYYKGMLQGFRAIDGALDNSYKDFTYIKSALIRDCGIIITKKLTR